MSARNFKNTQQKQSNTIMACCKVCKDAGKEEQVYTSHFVKDKQGIVICPTLLSLECRYCYKKGHTVSHCPVLKSNQKDKKKEEKKALIKLAAAQKETNKKTNITYNKYAIFDDSDIEDEEDITIDIANINEEEYPSLCGLKDRKQQNNATQQINSYASMAAKTAEEFENEQFEKKIKQNALKNIPIKTQYVSKEITHSAHYESQIEYDNTFEEEEEAYIIPQSPLNTPPPKRTFKASELNWAMIEDSSDDEEW